jgi:hypothetical protein
VPKIPVKQVAVTGGITKWKGKDAGQEAIANISSSLSLYDYDEMRNHPTIASGLEILKTPILNSDGFWECESEEIKEFIENNFNEFWTETQENMLTAFDYGFFAGEKVFGVVDGLIRLKRILPLKPHYLKILVNDKDTFSGIRQDFDKSHVDIPLEKSLLYTYKCEFGNYYGVSRLRPARFPYVVYKYIIEMTNCYYENHVDPITVTFAPEGKTKVDGKTIENIEYVNDTVSRMRSSRERNITFPARKKDDAQFDMKELSSGSDGGTNYIDYLSYLERRMLQGLLVPELLVMQNSKGSYAELAELSRLFMLQADRELEKIAKIKNDLAKQLIELNFKTPVKCTWNYTGLSKKSIELNAQLAHAMVQLGKAEPDLKWLSQNLGMPFNKTAPIETMAEAITKKTEVKAEKKSCGCGVHFEQPELPLIEVAELDRPMTALEKRVNFEKLKAQFESADSYSMQLNKLIDDMTKKLIPEIKKAILSGDEKAIADLQLEYNKKYGNLFVKNGMDIFEETVSDVRKELGLGGLEIGKSSKEIQKLKLRNVADKQMNDLSFNIKEIALSGMAQAKVVDIVEKEMKEYIDGFKDKVKLGVEISLQEVIDDGRRLGADDPSIELATWSALLDDRTCPACSRLDGMTVSVNDVVYKTYTPGNMHMGCRCVWVYTIKTDTLKPEVNFKPLPKELEDRYLKR